MRYGIVEGEPGIYPEPVSRLLRAVGRLFGRGGEQAGPPAPPSPAADGPDGPEAPPPGSGERSPGEHGSGEHGSGP